MKIGEIEKNIPFSLHGEARGKWKEVVTKMEVGDSILITLEDHEDIRNVQSSFYGSVTRYHQGLFRTKKIGRDLRIWRIE